MIITWILFAVFSIAWVPSTDASYAVGASNDVRMQTLYNGLKQARIQREFDQKQRQKKLEIGRQQKILHQASQKSAFQQTLERDRIQREKKRAEHQARLKMKRLQREAARREWKKNHDRKMAIYRLKMRGPKDCVKVENFKDTNLYPKNNNIVISDDNSFKFIYKYETYKCNDSRYADEFYKLVSISSGSNSNGSIKIGRSSNWKYVNKNMEPFKWVPDTKDIGSAVTTSRKNSGTYRF